MSQLALLRERSRPNDEARTRYRVDLAKPPQELQHGGEMNNLLVQGPPILDRIDGETAAAQT